MSKEGITVLIKSTLSNVPTYFLFLLPLQVGVSNRIEKLQCKFLLSGLDEEFKIHLVKWDKVCCPIFGAGILIHNLRVSNCAMWRYKGLMGRIM